MLKGMTAITCRTTGIGRAKKRAFSAVTFAPPANWASLAVPAIAGTRLNRISSVGISQSARRELVEAVGVFMVSARPGAGRPSGQRHWRFVTHHLRAAA